ncbi:MAG: NADH:flavin oxidoreductase [Halobacteriovoraceae bacterium]|nr:NADH:flavin oxidoreductase [Halobacteriovoraceae bacterium]
MLNINSKLNIGNFVLKNRVVVPPMASQTAELDGRITPKTIEHYTKLASSNASMIMVEYTYVHQSGKSEMNQLGISSDFHINGLKKLARRIKKYGAVAAIQLTHAGGKSSKDTTGDRLISPSGISVPVKGSQLEVPSVANEEDVQLLKQSFLSAAKRAYAAEFDVVELHSAHGYGLNQWISPITNQRSDYYGGTVENRFRLLLEIVNLIKKELPSLALSVRIPGMDHLEGGLTIEHSVKLAVLLENAGVRIINVSSGIGGWKRPSSRYGEGYLVADAATIQAKVKIPVIGVGAIQTATYINNSLLTNQFSLAAVGRAILSCPKWGVKVGLQ